MLLKVLLSLVVGIILYGLIGWSIDRLSNLLSRHSALRATLDWLLAMISPMAFGSVLVVLLSILSLSILLKIWPKAS